MASSASKLDFPQQGFTLIEILTVIAIVAIMAGITLTQISREVLSSDVLVTTGRQSIISSLSLARNYSFTGHICCGETTRPNGYGLYIPLSDAEINEVYYLYADYDADLQYTIGSNDEILSTNYLPDNVIFASCSTATISIVPAPNNYCDINFALDPDAGDYRLHAASDSLGSGWVEEDLSVTIDHPDISTTDPEVTIYFRTFVVK